MLSIFSCACWLPECLLWKNVYSGLLPIFGLGCLIFLMLNCMSCLYILDINPLLVISFANIFSHSVACLYDEIFKCMIICLITAFLHYTILHYKVKDCDCLDSPPYLQNLGQCLLHRTCSENIC